MRIGTSLKKSKGRRLPQSARQYKGIPESVSVRIRLAAVTPDRPQHPRLWNVIAASSVGTMIEWYDFYIFGSLATIIAPLFYPQGNDTLALIAYLSTFAVGFVVRPFGALVRSEE